MTSKAAPHQEPSCRRPRKNSSHPKDGITAAEIPQDPQPNYAQRNNPSNRDLKNSLVPLGMMPVHRDRNTLRNTKTESAALSTAARAMPDNNMPLDRWLGQTMADEPYNTLGFVQAAENLYQRYPPFHADDPGSLDATAASGAGKDHSQKDADHHKHS